MVRGISLLLHCMYTWIMHEYSVVTCYPIRPGDTRKTAQVDSHEILGYLVKATLLMKRFNSIFIIYHI